MSATLLLGKPCAEDIKQKISRQMQWQTGKLFTVGFAEDRWMQYSNSLAKSALNYGFLCEEIFVESNISPDDFCATVRNICNKSDATGVIIQQPLPKSYAHAVECVDISKDVDCLNPHSLAKLYLGTNGFRPATPTAVLRLLDYYNIGLQGKRIVIIGRGNAVGKPLALMTLQRNATVTVCHTKTVNLPSVCKEADVLISACGVANLVTSEFVTSKSIVIDVGLSFVNGKSCGDVAKEVYDICRAVSPVPGGVGPVTRAILFENLFCALNEVK